MMIEKTLSKIALVLFVCLIAGVCAVNGVAQSQGPGSPLTLYKRVGGYDAIAAVTDDFIGRLALTSSLNVSLAVSAPIRRRNSGNMLSISYVKPQADHASTPVVR